MSRILALFSFFVLLAFIYLAVREMNFFSLVFVVVFALWEKWSPRRTPNVSTIQRWTGNLGLFVFDTNFIRLLILPVFAQFTLFVADKRWGILNQFNLDPWIAFIISFVLMDLATYWIHRMFHRFSWAWKIHRVHHADLDVDISTAQRFHPFEILISFCVMQLFIVSIGPSINAVIYFNLSVFLIGIFRHANIRLPKGIDRVLQWIVVTPDMHLIHHSIDLKESNSNFGTNFPWWDHLWGTYAANAQVPLEKIQLGLKEFRESNNSNLSRIFLFPFVQKSSDS